jgi:DNA-binding GntR family transcriptional regulator
MSLEISLDRSSPVPLYYQLSQQLEHAVTSGVLKPGDQIAPEVELAQQLGLSRPTVRQGIQELVKKGVLVRRRGQGTQVVQSQVRRPVELSSLHDDLVRAGHVPVTKVLSLRQEEAGPDIAGQLGIPVGTSVHVIERLRSDGEEPLALMNNWIPADLLTLDADRLAEHGLYELMRRSGVQLHIANQRIGAKVASAAEGRLLRVKAGAALVTMQRTSFDDSGRIVEWAMSAYRADLYSYETTVVSG